MNTETIYTPTVRDALTGRTYHDAMTDFIDQHISQGWSHEDACRRHAEWAAGLIEDHPVIERREPGPVPEPIAD